MNLNSNDGESNLQQGSEEVEIKVASVPTTQKDTRACLACGILQTQEQFYIRGCPNCEEFLRLKQNKAKIMECTSSNFSGAVAILDPEGSWVARWQRLNGKRSALGIYAISVYGKLAEEDIEKMESVGKRYISLNRTT